MIQNQRLSAFPYLRKLFIGVALLALAGCAEDGPSGAFGPVDNPAAAPNLEDPLTHVGPKAYGPQTAGEAQLRGKELLDKGLYGLAEERFRYSVELNPRDPETWLGLAAAYDHLRRFDLADRAYAQVRKLLGPTAEVLNNEGYSQLLRGNLRQARALIERAHQMQPDNPVISKNLAELNGAESMRLPNTVMVIYEEHPLKKPKIAPSKSKDEKETPAAQ